MEKNSQTFENIRLNKDSKTMNRNGTRIFFQQKVFSFSFLGKTTLCSGLKVLSERRSEKNIFVLLLFNIINNNINNNNINNKLR